MHLVVIFTGEVSFCTQFKLIAAVNLEHITKWFLAFNVNGVKNRNELKGRVKIVSEGKKLCLVLKCDLGKLC